MKSQGGSHIRVREKQIWKSRDIWVSLDASDFNDIVNKASASCRYEESTMGYRGVDGNL
jgi:hypothetical protein